MHNYLDLMAKIMTEGEGRADRTGTGTLALFGEQLKFDLEDGFPAVTTKKLFFHGVVTELLWMLSGSQNIKWLNEHNVHIWDDWADEEGNLGPVYGSQWRAWGGHDQIATLIKDFQENPYSRRHILSSWNVSDLPKMQLPPSHVMSQFYIDNSDKLHCHMTQRSCDFFLGAPFNIAQYALLMHLLARETGLDVGTLTISYGDVHIYLNHLTQCSTQLQRATRELPQLYIKPGVSMFGLEPQDISLTGYDPHPTIKGEISV